MTRRPQRARTTSVVAALTDLDCATTGAIADAAGMDRISAMYALRCLERRKVVELAGKVNASAPGVKEFMWRLKKADAA